MGPGGGGGDATVTERWLGHGLCELLWELSQESTATHCGGYSQWHYLMVGATEWTIEVQ